MASCVFSCLKEEPLTGEAKINIKIIMFKTYRKQLIPFFYSLNCKKIWFLLESFIMNAFPKLCYPDSLVNSLLFSSARLLVYQSNIQQNISNMLIG